VKKQPIEFREELLSALVDGELTPEEEQVVQAHLKRSPKALALCQALRATKELLRTRLSERPLPEGLEARVAARLDEIDRAAQEVTAPRPQWRAPPSWLRWALAVVVLFLLGGGLFARRWFRKPPPLVLGAPTLVQAYFHHCQYPPDIPLPGKTPTQWAATLSERLGFPVRWGLLETSGLIVFAGGVCRCLHPEEAALCLCWWDQQKVSYFQFCAPQVKWVGLRPRSLGSRQVWVGQDAEVSIVAWQADEVWHVVVSQLPLARLQSWVSSPCASGK